MAHDTHGLQKARQAIDPRFIFPPCVRKQEVHTPTRRQGVRTIAGIAPMFAEGLPAEGTRLVVVHDHVEEPACKPRANDPPPA